MPDPYITRNQLNYKSTASICPFGGIALWVTDSLTWKNHLPRIWLPTPGRSSFGELPSLHVLDVVQMQSNQRFAAQLRYIGNDAGRGRGLERRREISTESQGWPFW